MRALLLAALLLPSTALAGDGAAARWNLRQPPLDEQQIEGLRKLGFRLEPDGTALDLELQALDDVGLTNALRLLDVGESRLRLERLRQLLSAEPQDRPLSAVARERALMLATPSFAARLADPAATAGQLRTLAALDLERATAAFDGAVGAKGAPAVVAPAGPTAARPLFPYLTAEEQRAGENLRAAAIARLSTVDHGRLILSRLNGKDGTPDLPPILVEATGTPARYDYARRSLVLDRDLVVAELLVGTLPVDFAARRRELDRPNALAAALAADPAAARRVIAANDVLVAHELIHGWQDRRDPLFRQMVRGALPPALVLEYEEEAFIEKNLYLHDLLSANPGVAVDPMELNDYQRMRQGLDAWRRNLALEYRRVEPRSASFAELRSLQTRRIDDLMNAPAGDAAQQRRRAARLRRMNLGLSAVDAAASAHEARLTELRAGAIAATDRNYHAVMGRHYLMSALRSDRPTQRMSDLSSALAFAEASRDEALIAEVRSHMEPRR